MDTLTGPHTGVGWRALKGDFSAANFGSRLAEIPTPCKEGEGWVAPEVAGGSMQVRLAAKGNHDLRKPARKETNASWGNGSQVKTVCPDVELVSVQGSTNMFNLRHPLKGNSPGP